MAFGIITTASFATSLQPELATAFGLGYKEKPEIYSRVFEVRASDRAFERFYKVGALGLPEQMSEGSAVKYHSMSELWPKIFTHGAFGLGIQVTKFAMDDCKDSPLAELKGKEMGRVMRLHKELAGAAFFDNGQTAADPTLGGDAVSLYSHAHPTAVGNQSNIASVAVALSELGLENADISIGQFQNEAGHLINATAKSIMVPLGKKHEIHRILKSDGQVYTPDNTPNSLKDQGIFPEVIVNPYLNNTTAYHILTDAAPGEGLLFLNRMAPTMSMDNVFDNDNAKVKTVMRYSLGHLDWRCAFLNAGA
jgi:hypothetical protein